MLRRFKPAVAPLKAAVFPLVQQPELNAHARTISASLTRCGLANSVDTTGCPRHTPCSLTHAALAEQRTTCSASHGNCGLRMQLPDAFVAESSSQLSPGRRGCSLPVQRRGGAAPSASAESTT